MLNNTLLKTTKMASTSILLFTSQNAKMNSGIIIKQCLTKLGSKQGSRCFSVGQIKRERDETRPTIAPIDLHNLANSPVVEEERRQSRKKLITVADVEDVSVVSSIPEEHIKTRTVRIFKPAKNAMQSGTDNTHGWQIDFDTRERWENQLMGWTSTGDPMSNLKVDFDSAESAIEHCKKMQWNYYVQKPNEHDPKPRSYGSNFAWNKRTRVTTK